ncbi:stage II sporulation protein D [Brevibacillus ginsengisoli]|uniref:stage II sporulation protein D n=1 Tax=Brevibacillus ginsengisoli TaxID=363854 RepID=UPI003CEDD887
MKRSILFLVIILPILLVIMPASLVFYFSPNESPTPGVKKNPPTHTLDNHPIKVAVYRTEKKQIESLPLERYIEGVVSAEMPAEFELEALKAQALAARTYIIRRLKEGKIDDAPQGAQVVDTIKHQAYLDDQQLKERWGNLYQWKKERVAEAVKETSGVVLTYKGEPIDATFFSTSNGFTENAEEYWNQAIPYLRSVASPWDRESPRYQEKISLSIQDFEQKMGVRLDQAASTGQSWYTVLERTTGNRIAKIRIGNKEFTGKETRERLGLNSASFTLERDGNQIWVTTHGYGHGVGMSQWGANGMAKLGKKAEQIVKYFYQGISLQNYQNVLKG